MAQEAAAPLLLDWSQGEKSGTVTVDHGTKASGLQACLNADTCEANVQAGLQICPTATPEGCG